ncbi:MAG TPA: hypothetical protein VEU28_09950 [Actinomycetota bacterium]|nr:hypothetical protein [Actinomycetota bacterium]
MLKRPKLGKREDASSAPAAPAGGSATPPPLPRSGGSGISPAALAAALGNAYTSPTGISGGGGGGSAANGISTSALGTALSGGGTSAGNKSVPSSRHTSYPLPGDLSGLPAKAGTRTGPRTTSYRIPLQRGGQSNVYDTVN